MPKIVRSHQLFHDDDCTLILEHPKDLARVTKLSESELVRRFEVFARIMFNHLLTEGAKEFEIKRDPESQEYVYLFPQKGE